MRRGRRNAAILAAIGVIGAIATSVILNRPLRVRVARVEMDVPTTVFGLGTVEARVLSKVGFEVGATLNELDADHGDRVGEGMVLARLHAAEQAARVAKAKAGTVNADAALRKAESLVGKARVVLAQRKQTNRRMQTLLLERAVSDEDAERAQLEVDVAAAELDIALSEAAVARAAKVDAAAEYEYEKAILGHHVLHAPYDALVVERHQELGAVLVPGEPVFTLIDPETVWVLGYVDESRAGGVRVGQPAEVRLRSLPGRTFPGEVVRVGIESDRVNEERRVYVACSNCPRPIHLGEQAEVFVTTGRLEHAVLVPETAVDALDDARGVIWTVEDGRLKRREVTLGERTLDGRVRIVDGLAAGALAVTESGPGFREGRRARPFGDGPT